ncbi:hypothetical protein E4T43_08866 [Aureobasidium subglaciale]|nr:hypothetical protein E4T43_08866 [Aureobasidium subglaciale]
MPSLEASFTHDEDVFDPKIHLEFSPAETVFSLADLGIQEHEYTTPIAGCTPFKLLSMEGVMAYRRAILRREVFEQCAGYPFPGTVTLRNVAKASQFVRDLWTHPKTIEIVSNVLGVKAEVIMDTEIGHTNIQVSGSGDVLSQLTIQPSQEARPLTKEEEAYDPLSGSSVIPWHYDSYPFVAIIMLSDTTHMKGGETYISAKDIQAARPSLGTAVILQGGQVKHLAARTFGSSERITTITSFRAADIGRWDNSWLANLRSYDNLPELYSQWSLYRLKKMRDELDAAVTKIETANKSGDIFVHQETEALCDEISRYSKRTARQMVDPEIRDGLARKYGAKGISEASKYWHKVRATHRESSLIADATKYAEENMPRMKGYTLDWCQTRGRIQRGSRERGTQGLIVWDEQTDYLLGDELESQGLNEILLYWMEETGLMDALAETAG